MDFSPHADDFIAHYRSVRGQVRLRLLHEQVRDLVPPGGRILDVGGGAGHLAALLAADGLEVVVVDPSARMRQAGGEVVGAVGDVADRVAFEAGAAADVPGRADAGTYDAVLCHAVAPYVDDLDLLVSEVVAGARPGGLVSIVVKNRDALAMRPALEGRWADVPGAVDAPGDAGGLGVENLAHTLAAVQDALRRHGCEPADWYGIRVVSDVLPHEAEADVEQVLAAERALTSRDPYRALGRLLHVTATKGPTTR